MSMCLEKTERSCGRETYDDEICYQVRGKFGNSKDEDQDDIVRGRGGKNRRSRQFAPIFLRVWSA